MTLDSIQIDLVIHKMEEYLLKSLVEVTQENSGDSIFNEFWNHLLIIDNCRFDTFKKEYLRRNLPGRLLVKRSLGSWTGDYLRRNFREKHDDIVVVTANPFSNVYLKGKVYKILPVWKTSWDERYNTVLPSEVYRSAINALKKYPDKRLIVHFLQPHHPYLTLPLRDEGMRVIRDTVINQRIIKTVIKEPINELYLSEIYARVPLPRLIKAYMENLQIVLPYVELLIHRLPGRVVVTSDHGELFGEKVLPMIPIRVYGHGIGRNPSLIHVPWWVIEENDKEMLRPVKDIKKEIIKTELKLDLRDTISERLRLKGAIRRLKMNGLV